VSADLVGLTPDTQYYYRVVATSSAGTAYGSQGTFTTTQPPSATTGAASGVTNTTATIAGSVNPNGLDTSYHFEYGTTPSYGTSTTAVDDGSGTGTDSVNAALSGLTQGTTYYYRLVATSVGGTTNGSQGTFTTTQPPTATTGSASSITATAAAIAGSVNPNGVDTTYHFEYGTTPSFGTSTTAVDDGSGTSASTVQAGLTGLTPGTTYYYRLVATSVAGTTDGAQGTFATIQPPSASTGAASAITTTTATLTGSVNPNGVATTYHFDYGTTPGYGSSTPATAAGSASTSGTATANLTGLTPGTKYYFRLVATSVGGTTDGSQASLTTATPPPPPPPPPPCPPPPHAPPPRRPRRRRRPSRPRPPHRRHRSPRSPTRPSSPRPPPCR
jgi:phosphodiesterase/alkaline phosphatase D-like protein